MGLFDIFRNPPPNDTRGTNDQADTEFAAEDDATMRLHEEELDISKDRVSTGSVSLHKEVVSEEQAVNVPVAHDEVVIERRALNHTPSAEPVSEEETVNIPLTAERVNVGKHTVVTEEISAHKQEVQGTEQVSDVLHKEVAHIDKDGEAVVTDMDTNSDS